MDSRDEVAAAASIIAKVIRTHNGRAVTGIEY